MKFFGSIFFRSPLSLANLRIKTTTSIILISIIIIPIFSFTSQVDSFSLDSDKSLFSKAQKSSNSIIIDQNSENSHRFTRDTDPKAEPEPESEAEPEPETGAGENSVTEKPSGQDPFKSFKCTNDSKKMDPCMCLPEKFGLVISCSGPSITQQTINRVIAGLREENFQISNSNPDFNLYLHQFKIRATLMTSLDLTPFHRISMNRLNIEENWNLTTLTGPPFPAKPNNFNNFNNQITTTTTPKSSSPGKIRAIFLSFYFNALQEKGFGRALDYFDYGFIEKLDLSMNSFTGTSTFIVNANSNGNNNNNGNWNNRDYEFLPSLANLTMLRDLNLGGNKIRRLESGRFKHLIRLENLGLYNNKMEDVMENALLFNNDPPGVDRVEPDVAIIEPWRLRPLNVWLYDNLLSENRLPAKYGVESMRRAVNLKLNGNKLTTIPQQKFQPILEANNNTIVLYLKENPIVCDNRLKWLVIRKPEWENKMMDAECKNDEKRNVFTSTLVK